MKNKKLNNFFTKEFLFLEYIQNQKSISKIATENNCSFETVRRYIDKYNIVSNRKQRIIELENILTKKFLYEHYFNLNKSTQKIAEEVGCIDHTVASYLRKFGLEIKQKNKYEKILTKEFLTENYLLKKKTFAKISQETGCDEQTIYNYCRKYQIKIRSKKEAIPSGPLHPKWIHPSKKKYCLYKQIRNSIKYKDWRKTCFERDNYTCQECGDNKGGNLHVDHIKPFSIILKENNITIDNFEIKLYSCKELWDINNGRTLCEICHKKTNTYGMRAKYFKVKK